VRGLLSFRRSRSSLRPRLEAGVRSAGSASRGEHTRCGVTAADGVTPGRDVDALVSESPVHAVLVSAAEVLANSATEPAVPTDAGASSMVIGAQTAALTKRRRGVRAIIGPAITARGPLRERRGPDGRQDGGRPRNRSASADPLQYPSPGDPARRWFQLFWTHRVTPFPDPGGPIAPKSGHLVMTGHHPHGLTFLRSRGSFPTAPDGAGGLRKLLKARSGRGLL
jgi:hypothetical protein